MGECQKGNTKAVDSSRAFRVLQGQSWRSGVMLPGNLSLAPFLDMFKAVQRRQKHRQMLLVS